jgi:hypothetical protein
LSEPLLEQLQTNADRKGQTASDYIRQTLADVVLGNAKTQTDKAEHEATRAKVEKITEGLAVMVKHYDQILKQLTARPAQATPAPVHQ